jgi:hypothetical protein
MGVVARNTLFRRAEEGRVIVGGTECGDDTVTSSKL